MEEQYRRNGNAPALHLRPAVGRYLRNLGASGSHQDSYIRTLQDTLLPVCEFSEEYGWPTVDLVESHHLEDYLFYVRSRTRTCLRSPGGRVPLSQSYVESIYSRIQRFFNWAIRQNLASRNPINLIPRPRVAETLVQTVPERVVHGLLNLVDPEQGRRNVKEQYTRTRNRAMIYLLCDTPIRRAELNGISLDDLNLERGLVKVMGKGRRERLMPIGRATAGRVAEYLALRSQAVQGQHDALWISWKGEPMLDSWVLIVLRRMGKKLGVRLHTHQFRHTFAVTALRSGMPERVLMDVGGWKNQIPPTYLRTLSIEDAQKFHKKFSPGDGLDRLISGPPDAQGNSMDQGYSHSGPDSM